MEMAPLLGADGTPLAARGWFDAELLENDNGTLYVGLERVEQIVRFDYARDGLLARAEPLKVPADFKTFKFNKSLECLAMPPKGSLLAGTLIVITERSLDAQGNHRSYLLNGDHVERFSVKRSDDFDVSDCTILPPADLLLLERRYSMARGVAMRIRRIAACRHSSRAHWSTAGSSSRPISVIRSTTWKASPCTKTRKARPSSRWCRTTIFRPRTAAIAHDHVSPLSRDRSRAPSKSGRE